MHPLRLGERCPSAVSLGVVELPNRIVRFGKRSDDKSGKCTLMEEADHMAYGVLYEMDLSDKPALDRAEGLSNGYATQHFQIPYQGKTYHALSYIAQYTHLDLSLRPYDWYKAIVVCSAHHMHMPEEYIAELDAAQAMNDPDKSRRANEFARLQRMGCLV
jgi:gamma-glutamylcyclotransferase